MILWLVLGLLFSVLLLGSEQPVPDVPWEDDCTGREQDG